MICQSGVDDSGAGGLGLYSSSVLPKQIIPLSSQGRAKPSTTTGDTIAYVPILRNIPVIVPSNVTLTMLWVE